MPPHSLTNFEIRKNSRNESKFNGVYSRKKWSKIKDGAYIINLYECKSIGPHWISLFVIPKSVTHFDRLGFKNTVKETTNFIGTKNIITNIHRMQAFDSIMCRYFCIGFIDFMLKGKILLEYTNLCSPNQYI